jgi:acetyl-CoA carboxylase biotin carboxyl carrier protein
VSNNAKKTGPFDVKTVEALVALMAENDLSEIYLKEGSQHLRLRRGSLATPMMHAPVSAASPVAHPSPPAATSAAPTTPAKSNLVEIKSESVGTFYSQSKPSDPPFVKVGDRVTPNKVVGLVEVMKTYSEILANCSGTIVEVVVENGKYVEFDQVLFRVDPS